MKRLYCLFIIILCLAISIPSYAQFTINGKHIIYDKQNDLMNDHSDRGYHL